MFDQPEKRTEVVLLPEAYRRAEAVLEKKRIRMEDFTSLYGDDVITADRERLTKRELEIRDMFDPKDYREEHVRELSTIFHAIAVNNPSWFGMPTNTSVYATTRFDDVFHGVDAVVERRSSEGSSHLGLAIDFTFGHLAKKKVGNLVHHIDQGSLTRVKYFASAEKGFRGELSELPSVVVGVNADTVSELANLFAQKEDAKIEMHQVQFQVLEQIILQCRFFADYAREKGREDLAEKYEKIEKLMEGTFNMSKRLVDDSDKGLRDSFHRELLSVITRS